MTIAASHDAFRAAVADVRTGADALGDSRDRIDREVGALLDGDWTGLAADAFADAWQEWQTGARRVAEALAVMGGLLDAVQRDLWARDTDAQARLDAVHGRLSVTDRLTGRLG
jgi:WXG100 family type VII secretion target